MANMELCDAMIHAYIQDQLTDVVQYKEEATWFSSPDRKMLVNAQYYGKSDIQTLLICYNVANHEISVFNITRDKHGVKEQ
jgi:hypothetical protein